MTDKIQPTNPGTPTPADHKPGRAETERKTNASRWGRRLGGVLHPRKLARRLGAHTWSDRAMKTGIVSVEW